MKNPVIVIGMGEMGSVFARAILKLGYPVYPVNRDTNVNELAEIIPQPELVLVAVGKTPASVIRISPRYAFSTV